MIRISRFVVALLIAAVSFAGVRIAQARFQGSQSGATLSGYWHTSGTQIVDAAGHPVRIAAVTWYGMESTYWVPAGLDYQPYTRIMDEVKAMGLNTIRLPYSNQLVEQNPVVTTSIRANPQFKGMHALGVLDAIVNYAQKIGLKIILDDHRSSAATPATVNHLSEALWYSARYPESAWIRDWQFLAKRYRGNSAVIGFDLRNEPHTDGPGPWSLHTYLYQGATWGPYGGRDNARTDWRLAAERAGNAILSVNPHLLMFVEGLQMYPASNMPRGVFTYWWGSVLSPVKQYPITFKVPHQLVYSPHDWGPRKHRMSWFVNSPSYSKMQSVWWRNWSYLLTPHQKYTAPIWLGEFGTCNDEPYCVDEQKPGNEAQWFHFLLRFLKQHPNVGWGFYALNGTNSNDHMAQNALLNHQWSAPANKALIADLRTVENP